VRENYYEWNIFSSCIFASFQSSLFLGYNINGTR